MRIAACQMTSGTDPERNVIDAVDLISAAAQSECELVILPENFALFDNDAANLAAAECFDDGPIQEAIRMAAVRGCVWVVAGSVPLKSDDPSRYTNSCLVYAPDGSVAARYDRIHLFRYCNGNEFYDERLFIEPGTGTAAFDLTSRDGNTYRIGLGLGFDLRFPEHFRALGMPDVIALPAAFTQTTGRAHWSTLLKARAIENQCFVAAAAQGGVHECGRSTWGHSVQFDPWGNTLAELPTGKGLVIADISFKRLHDIRKILPALEIEMTPTA